MAASTSYRPFLHGNLGFISALFKIKPHSLEETVQVTWQAIIATWFPVPRGYRCHPKRPCLTNNNMPDAVVIQVIALDPNPINQDEDFAERQILLVECKRPSLDTPQEWDDTVKGQFQDDLSTNLNSSEKDFRAVAIGTKVKFYRFDGQSTSQPLEPLHQGTIDMATDSGITEVERMMDYIKTNAWQWTG